jgi:hypothetical protein
MTRCGAAAAAFVLVATLAIAVPAHADAIDGNWCSRDGKSLSIEGPKIRTPSGADLLGRYARHAFAYEAPASEAEAGQIVVMRLVDEEDMIMVHLKDGVAGPVEDWRRCNVTS